MAFLMAICDKEQCLVNTDFIIEVYDLYEDTVRAYTMDSDYPYYIEAKEWEHFLEAERRDDERINE